MQELEQLTITQISPRHEELLTELLHQQGSCGTYIETDERCATSTVRSFFPKKVRVRGPLIIEQARRYGINITPKTMTVSVYRPRALKTGKKLITIGKFVVVSTQEKHRFSRHKIFLRIDDAQAFGTGLHETTQMCLRAIRKYFRTGNSVLDIGTGTGILAIAAVQLGAKKVTAIENDPVACDVARKNIRVNDVQKNISLSRRDVSNYHPGKKFNMIIANLTVDILKKILMRLRSFGDQRAIYIFSGLHREQFYKVRPRLTTHFSMVQKLSKGDWLTIVARKK